MATYRVGNGDSAYHFTQAQVLFSQPARTAAVPSRKRTGVPSPAEPRKFSPVGRNNDLKFYGHKTFDNRTPAEI